MQQSPWSIGIDLGTSHSAISLMQRESGELITTPIPQLGAPGRIENPGLLPSALYLLRDEEKASESFRLPWGNTDAAEFVVGSFAKEQAANLPDRVVISAKSWLSAPGVDRRSPLLPQPLKESERRISPVHASSLILSHLRAALRQSEQVGSFFAGQTPEVVITVPASFDEVARVLTLEAAREAGFSEVVLLEEPQAAVYSWIHQHQESWTEQMKAGELLLVCDVGGGTTDFSLLAVTNEGGELSLQRVSVGDHILLGGDNMDLALAMRAASELESRGTPVAKQQFPVLTQLMRRAKEALFSAEAQDFYPITLPSVGSDLFAAPLSYNLEKRVLEEMVVEGFFPEVAADERPQQKRRGGLRQAGLPYASDAAITRHLAGFLNKSAATVANDATLSGLFESQNFFPSAVLFNGGVFHAEVLRTRVMALLREWSGRDEIRELGGISRDTAVSAGAAVFAAQRQSGTGFRIRAKTARSYYLGIESSMPAVPGFEPPLKGLCVVRQGLEEGSSFEVPEEIFHLLTGEETQFHLFSSTTRSSDQIGILVDDASQTLQEAARVTVSLPSSVAGDLQEVPVKLEVTITETGVLELWMVHTESDMRWKLEFTTRDDAS